MKKIEFGELHINDTSKGHIQDCLDNNWITMGPKTKMFEERWSKLFNYPYTVAFNSGTSADMAACMALYEFPELDAQPGDEIICPALSFIASGTSIIAAGFKPVFVDVDYQTLTLNVDQVCDAITKRTKAIMGVNLMGKPCDMVSLDAICTFQNIKLIIDNCEAYGCKLNKRYSLEYADMETTSSFSAHIIASCEEGNVSARTKEVDNILRHIRSHGINPENKYFDHQMFGLNLRPTDLHLSIGLGELDNFWDIFNSRKDNLYTMRDACRGFEDIAWFIEEENNEVIAPHAFSITLKPEYCSNMSLLIDELNKAGIHWKRNFGSIPHHRAMRKFVECHPLSMPRSRYIGDYGIHIGCHQFLTAEDLEYICTTLRNILGKMTKN